MGFIERVSDRIKTGLLKALTDIIGVESLLRYQGDYTFDNPRDIPSVGYVQILIDGSGSGLTKITLTGAELTDIGGGFYTTPLPALTEEQTIVGMIKVFPDVSDLATFYFKNPEVDGSDLINIEWDGLSDIQIIITIG